MASDKKNLTRPKRTTEELQKASDALYYEVWMFAEMVKSLSTQSPQPGNPQYNALVESFVQHTRNLIEFFYPQDGVHSDTIIAKDFFINPNRWEESIPPWLDNERRDTHLFLAHLTYDRIGNKKKWDYPKISEYINGVFNKFIREASQDLIGGKLKGYKISEIGTQDSSILTSTGDLVLPGPMLTRDLFNKKAMKR